ncbi:MAG TPA: redox-regulated ATPase YchF, partial [Methanophagales archaeon]|nr:redox-regulated ATPase YchF [Methanophagales archaeon]
EGKGLGNEFLDELRQAEAIIHVVDASGGTDADGNVAEIGSHDPLEDIVFFKEELNMWVYGIIKRNWRKLERRAELEGDKIERLLSEQLAGVGVTEEQIKAAIFKSGISDMDNIKSWGDEDLKNLASHIVKRSKKMIIVANKADIAPEENMKALKEVVDDELVIPCSAAAELALRTAAKNNFIQYLPGDTDFEIAHEVTEKQRKGLESIKKLIHAYDGTGVQEVINRVVFDLLQNIVAYTVEDEHKLADSTGRILPDAYILKIGSTPRDLAFAVHSDLGEGFLYAVDARTKLRLSEKHALKDRDITKVVYTR